MNPLTDLPQMCIGELGRTTEMFLVFRFLVDWSKKGKTAKIVIYDQARVNSGFN